MRSRVTKNARKARNARVVTPDVVSKVMDVATVRYDKDGDDHYDVISAFIKSMRGSDPDATMHYLARMLRAGEDPRFIARRIMIAASEEVGMAAPQILQVTVAAAQAVALVGMPEARIILAEAALAVATAPNQTPVIMPSTRRSPMWMPDLSVKCRCIYAMRQPSL